jgi:hypothetical protein
MRGYQEDGYEVGQRGYKPGAIIDVTVPAWRVGEALLHARMLAGELGEGDIEIVFRVRYTGLAGRTLVSVSGERLLLNRDVSRQYAIVLDATINPSEIQDRLPEIVQGILAPFYEMFDFFQPPATLVPEEIGKMRAGRF